MKKIIKNLRSIIWIGVIFISFGLGQKTQAATLANSFVNKTLIQSDGKIIIVGVFTTYNGTARNYITRTRTDGSLDTNFTPGAGANSTISSVALQSDGKILIGGYFTTYNGTGRNRIARINTNGTLDTNFNPGTGTNGGYVSAIAIQADGKIIIGGSFSAYNGTSINNIARINTDGTLDTSFTPGTGANNSLETIAIQADGKILIGGSFTTYNGTSRGRIARLNTDGTLDTGFNSSAGASSTVSAIAIQTDGKSVIVGNFTTYNGTARARIARVNTDGTLDTSFAPGTGVNSASYAIAIQTDGRIIIGGTFTTYSGTTIARIARINTDGTLDTSFAPGTGANNGVTSAVLQSDGKIIIGGSFTTYNSVTRGYIARIASDGTNEVGFGDLVVIAPTITTQAPTLITTSSATGRGNVSDNGGSNPTRYIEWGTTSGVYTNSCSAGTGGLGDYSCSISGLTHNTVYYVRAKATNTGGAAYGTETSFQTLQITIPTINTNSTTSITAISATSNASITNFGNENSLREIEWGTTSGIYTSSCSSGIGGVGNYSCSMSGLIPNTTYYVRAKATNSAGTGYGSEISFQTQIVLIPVVTTGIVNGICANAARGYGNITDTGYETPERIIEWGTAPGVYTNFCSADIGTTGAYSCPITSLAQNTTYYVRAKATNSAGTAYGSEVSFQTSSMTNDLANGLVNRIVVQQNNKSVISGNFSQYNGMAVDGVARINADGTLDGSFNPPNEVKSVFAVQSDGKFIASLSEGGNGYYGNITYRSIARLNADGSLDNSFPQRTFLGYMDIGFSDVYVQSDDKILIGGSFTSYDGVTARSLIRLNSNGTIDSSFLKTEYIINGDSSSYGDIHRIGVQSDGKIVVVGKFGVPYLGSADIMNIARLNSDGSLDATFNPGNYLMDYYPGARFFVIQSDGKIVSGTGYFDSSVRLNSDGSLDGSYVGYGNDYSDAIKDAILLPNGKIMAVGWFNTFLSRINSNGTLDSSFSPTFNSNIERVYLRPDGKIFVCGNFTTYNGATANRIALLNSDGSFNTSFGNAPAITAPTLTTSPSTLIRRTTATLNANLSDTGGENPNRTIQWGAQSGTYTNTYSAGTGGTGNFSHNLSGLSPNTAYYYRATATNSAGTTNGNEMSFTTLPTSITIIDPTPAKMNSALSSNYLALESGASSATPKTTTNTAVTFQTSMASLSFPAATDITNTDSGNFNLENFVTTNKTDEVKQTFVSTIAAVKVGVPNTKLSFSQLATLSIDVDPFYNNRPMYVFYKNDGITDDWINHTMCTITDGKCTFTTNHATTYTVKMDGSMVGETGINLNTDVQEVIALDCGTSIVNMGNLTPGTPVTGSSTCLTTTNANGGYNLSVRRDDSTDTTMDKTTEDSTNITDKTSWSPSTPNATTWTGTGLGFTVYDSTANKNTTWWGTGSTVTDASNLYAGFAPTNTDIMRYTTYSNLGTTTSIGYKLDVPPSQKSGAYSGAITYQVTTTP